MAKTKGIIDTAVEPVAAAAPKVPRTRVMDSPGGPGAAAAPAAPAAPAVPPAIAEAAPYAPTLSDYSIAKSVPQMGSVTSEQTVQGQLGEILKAGNPLLEGARARAMKAANARGLQNTSMAAQAGEEAIVNSALPIATADAAAFQKQSLVNQDISNQFLSSQFTSDLDLSRAYEAFKQNNMMFDKDAKLKTLLTDKTISSQEKVAALQAATQQAMNAANIASSEKISTNQLATQTGIAGLQSQTSLTEAGMQQQTARETSQLQAATTLTTANLQAETQKYTANLSADTSKLVQTLANEGALARETLQAQTQTDIATMNDGTQKQIAGLQADTSRYIAEGNNATAIKTAEIAAAASHDNASVQLSVAAMNADARMAEAKMSIDAQKDMQAAGFVQSDKVNLMNMQQHNADTMFNAITNISMQQLEPADKQTAINNVMVPMVGMANDGLLPTGASDLVKGTYGNLYESGRSGRAQARAGDTGGIIDTGTGTEDRGGPGGNTDR